jgi:hypothetical protein
MPHFREAEQRTSTSKLSFMLGTQKIGRGLIGLVRNSRRSAAGALESNSIGLHFLLVHDPSPKTPAPGACFRELQKR